MVTENLEYCVDDCEGCRRAHKDFDPRECCQTRNTVKKHSAEFALLGPAFRKLVARIEALEAKVAELIAEDAESAEAGEEDNAKTQGRKGGKKK